MSSRGEIYITGGMKIDENGHYEKYVEKIEFIWNKFKESKSFELDLITVQKLPLINIGRYFHSSFICRKFLILAFGQTDIKG